MTANAKEVDIHVGNKEERNGMLVAMKQGVKYAWARVPNFDESAVISVFDVLTQMTFSHIYVPKSTAGGEFLRDLGKSVSIMTAPYLGLEHGGTGVAYGSGDLAGSGVRGVLKGTSIGIGFLSGASPETLEFISQTSNLVFEPVARTCAVLNGRWQKSHNDTGIIDFTIYYKDNITPAILAGVIPSATAKKSTAMVVAGAIKQAGYDPVVYANKHLLGYQTDMVNWVYGLNLEISGGNLAGLHSSVVAAMQNKEYSPLSIKMATALLYSSVFVANFAISMIKTYMIVPPVRIVQDSVFAIVEACVEDFSKCTNNTVDWIEYNLFHVGLTIFNIAMLDAYMYKNDHSWKRIVGMDVALVTTEALVRDIWERSTPDEIMAGLEKVPALVSESICNNFGYLCGETPAQETEL